MKSIRVNTYVYDFRTYSTMAVNFIAKAPAMFLRFSQPRLATFVKYAKVELTPPSPGEIGQASSQYALGETL